RFRFPNGSNFGLSLLFYLPALLLNALNGLGIQAMEITVILLAVFVAWQFLRVRYQRGHIALLGRHLANFRLEQHMETLTQGYTRAIRESDESRQLQVLE